jgi:HD-like signal output (HDOD) protein
VPQFVIPFIVFDLIVTIAVIVVVLKRRGSLFAMAIGTKAGAVNMEQMRALMTFAREQHARIGEYMRANWSGMPEQLPSVITALLDELERTAKEQNLPIDRAMLKPMVASSLRMHGVGKRPDRDQAFQRVA